MAFIASTFPFARYRTLRANRCPMMTLKVVVTGAGGRTGSLVLQKLHAHPDFEATGVVRDTTRGKEAVGDGPDLVLGDVTDRESLKTAFTGKDALVVLTSAMPKLLEQPANGPPIFTFDKGGRPEDVDWEGGKNQIDLAKELGFKHVVFVGSMGSTDDNHPLNRIGNGNILRYKRKAEMYLIESGVPYTIINPGGLKNDPENERELVVGSGDELFAVFGPQGCSIPRADVARVVVSALSSETAKNKALDLISKQTGEGTPTADPASLFSMASPNL